MMTLVPEIDEKATKAKAREVLKKCRSLQRITGISVDSIRSPEFSDMPKSPSNRNNTEYQMIHKLRNVSSQDIGKTKAFTLKIIDITKALNALSDISCKILEYSYCEKNSYSNAKIAKILEVYKEREFGQVEQIEYSVKNIENLKAQALLEFAEAYRGGELLIYKSQKN